jgi:hypothetical protein
MLPPTIRIEVDAILSGLELPPQEGGECPHCEGPGVEYRKGSPRKRCMNCGQDFGEIGPDISGWSGADFGFGTNGWQPPPYDPNDFWKWWRSGHSG